MPYKREWDPNVAEVCDTTEWVKEWRKEGGKLVEEMVQKPCGRCDGTGWRKVGGWVQVWVDPPQKR